MHAWGRFIATQAKWIVLASVLLAIAAGTYGLGVFGALTQGGYADSSTDSFKAEQLAKNLPSTQPDVIALYTSTAITAGDPRFAAHVQASLAAIPADAVAQVISPFGVPPSPPAPPASPLPTPASAMPVLVSPDGTTVRVFLTLRGESEEQKKTHYDQLSTTLKASGTPLLPAPLLAGRWSVADDIDQQIAGDIARAEMISLPIVLLLSLVIFGSVVAALMPTLIGVLAVLGAFAIVRLITEITEVSTFSINIITMLGMGLAIDYALFIVSRFREQLHHYPQPTPEQVRGAIVETMTTAGRTVLFSGLIVAASLASLLLFPYAFLRSMAYGGIAAVLVAAGAALTVLPAVLMVLGRRIDALPLHRRHVNAGRRQRRYAKAWPVRAGQAPLPPHPHAPQAVMWGRIGALVMRRPAWVTAATVLLLAVLAAPFLDAHWGGVDERVLPTSTPSRQALALQQQKFGEMPLTATIALWGSDQQAVDAYLAAASAVPGVGAVAPAGQATVQGRPLTVVRASWQAVPEDEQSQRIVSELRDVAAPAGTQVYVGGAAAEVADIKSGVASRIPLMVGLVILIMTVLLFVAFGSLVVPLKAVVVSALSLASCFGVVTWIFQQGHFSRWLGFTSAGHLDATIPILMVAILFGLSMDYEVFLLSRIREEWDRRRSLEPGAPSQDHQQAIVVGLQRSGRIITSAALLLAVVIGGFATSGIIILKMVGVGMLVAVLLDATVVRALLVPAVLRLLGPASWWAPAPLARWWSRHGIRE